MADVRGMIVQAGLYGGALAAHAWWIPLVAVAARVVTALSVVLVAVLTVDRADRVAMARALAPVLISVLLGQRYAENAREPWPERTNRPAVGARPGRRRRRRAPVDESGEGE